MKLNKKIDRTQNINGIVLAASVNGCPCKFTVINVRKFNKIAIRSLESTLILETAT